MSDTIQKIIEREIRQKSLFYPFIQDLTQKERAVLELRKKEETEDKPTLQKVGKRFGLTRERIRQIAEKAQAKLDAQADIIQRLAQKISESVFDEAEVEQAFIDYYGGEDSPDAKLKWLEISRLLWENKKNQNEKK